MATWKDIKLASLQKMFAAEGNTIPNDESVTDYIASMPQACNEALSIVSRVGKYIIKSVSIAHNPIPNMLPNKVSELLLNESYSASVQGAKSFYFEYSGTGTLEIYEDDVLMESVPLDSDTYTNYKGFLDTYTGTIKFKFIPTYPLNVVNLAFYPCLFKSVDVIPSFQEKIKYNLTSLAGDFYKLDSIYYEGEHPRYIQTSEYSLEGNDILVLNSDMLGNYIVYYKAFPEMITASTEDDYVFPISDDFLLLLPLYIASELYKEDDLAIATSYRNEFEVEVSRLMDENAQAPTAEFFDGESGWI